MTDALYRQLCDLIDWSRPELAATEFAACYQRGDYPAAARGFARYLRARPRPQLGYSADYIAALRAAVTPEQLADASAKMDGVLTHELQSGVHGSPLLSLGAEVYQLAATEAQFLAMAGRIAELRESWGAGAWGTTHSICNFLQSVWPLAEFPDDALIVLLCWLHAQWAKEWAWARTWEESMLGNSGHNWWLHTFGGCWKAGLFFPEIRDFTQFRAFAPAYLEREMSVLMAPDGFTRERSGYHWGTADMFLSYTKLAELNGITFSSDYYARLQAIANVEWKLTAPDGDLPLVGDTSSGCAPGREFTRLRWQSAQFGIPAAKYVAEALDPHWQPPYADLLPRDGENLLSAYRQLPAQAPASTDTCLPESGYYFMRQDWTPKSDWVCLDAGARGSLVTSHDHTAFFHLLLYSQGRPILLDNCSGPYGDEPSRRWRVGSFAHNVATVDGEDHLPIRSEWRWDAMVTPVVDAWISAPDYAYFSGAHEGYGRLAHAVSSSRRKLFYLRGGYWVLIDRFTTSYMVEKAAHRYQQHFHLGPPAELLPEGRVVTRGDGGNLLIVPVPGVNGTAVLEPNPYPLDGYDNPAHLSYTRVSPENDLLVTLLAPFTGAMPDVQVQLLEIEADGRVLAPWEATALEIVIEGRRDVYVDLHMQWNLPWRVAEFSGETRLFHSRVPVTAVAGAGVSVTK